MDLPVLYVTGSKVVGLNKALISLVGYCERDFLDKTISEVLSILRCNYSFDNGEDDCRDHFIFTKNYKAIEVNITIDYDNEKGQSRVVLEEKPNSSIENKCLLFNHLYMDNKIGIAMYSEPDTILLKANQIYLNFFDKPFNTMERTIGRKIDEFVTGWKGSNAEKVWKSVISKGETYYTDEFEYIHFHRGKTYWKFSIIPIFEHNLIKYIIQIAEEITEKVLHKRVIDEQTKIIAEQKDALEKTLKMQEEFFSFISHEFKTPLTVTMSAVQVMELTCKDELTERSKKYIKRIYQSSLQQMRLVNNLLDITRADAGYLKINKRNVDIVNMTRAIVDSILLYAKDKNIDIEFSSTSPKIMMATDDEKYERIMLNLLSNAIKFTPANKRIRVKIFKRKDKLYISVIDEGVGIPKEKQAIIFERFGQVDNSLTRSSEGTGIGLCLVKLLINSLDGEIKVKSKVGLGTAFTITFPITEVEHENILHRDLMDDRLIRTVNIEFSNIYTS